MRRFIRGERLTGLLVLLFTVLAATTALSLILTVAARLDATAARHAAKADRDALVKVTGALRHQCAQQLTEQISLRGVEHADADLQRGLIAADRRNVLITRRIREARAAVYRAKLARDLQFLATPRPEPAVCSVFSEPLPIAFRAIG